MNRTERTKVVAALRPRNGLSVVRGRHYEIFRVTSFITYDWVLGSQIECPPFTQVPKGLATKQP